jgi:hypothetical protein
LHSSWRCPNLLIWLYPSHAQIWFRVCPNLLFFSLCLFWCLSFTALVIFTLTIAS